MNVQETNTRELGMPRTSLDDYKHSKQVPTKANISTTSKYAASTDIIRYITVV